MRHVRQEPRLQFVGPPEMIRLFIQFRVERDDPAIGIFEFAIQSSQFLLPAMQFVERAQQFLVLDLDFFDQSLRAGVVARPGGLFDALRR